MYDLVIKGATIVDGTGGPVFAGDVAVKDGMIVVVGRVEGRAARIVEATGLVASPGFIDIHTHADMGALMRPTMPNYLCQGVTTAVTGNCGLTLAPCRAEHAAELREYLEPFLPTDLPPFEWTSFGEFLDRVDATIPAINLAPLVGHGTIRIAVAGFENRRCTPFELEAMRNLLGRSIEEGCHGLSTGLFYPPGSYADRAELDSLFEVLGRYGAVYSTHLRSEGRQLVESVEEAIDLGERHGVSVELSHHKASPQPYWGKVSETLKIARLARTRGCDAGIDAYPYDASCTTVTALLPPEALVGGVAAALARLSDPGGRGEIARLMTDVAGSKDLFVLDVGWESIFVIACPPDRRAEGMSLSALVGAPPIPAQLDRFFDWLVAIRGDALIGARSMAAEDIEMVISDPDTIIASDSWAEDPVVVGKCHPRAFGTFPRLIGHYYRELGLLSLPDAVRRITSLPARKMHFLDRGLLRPGMKADIAVFDPMTFVDRATYMDPKLPPEGLKFVLVNGGVAYELGAPTGLRNGGVIRRPRGWPSREASRAGAGV